MRRAALPGAVAATAAAVLVAGLVTTADAGAAPANKLAGGVKTTKASLKGKNVDKRLSDLPAGVPKSGSYTFLLALDAKSTMSAQKAAGTKSPAAAKSAAKAQLAKVTAAQSAVIKKLPSGSAVVYKTHAVMSAVAVRTDVKNFDKLEGISGVSKVYAIAPKSLSNSYAVPLQGAPQAWVNAGTRGENTKVAIIDTGIDYTHADFGGPGTVSAYKAALATDDQPADPSLFPTSKIVGGYDLVGDSYNADPAGTDGPYQPVPHPDTNPLDCNSHGTHVAGTVGGYGENADGSTYTGKYNKKTPFDTMKIGPGVAPEAQLLSYRVFGCAGSTDVVGEAIDMAADPNGDGDTSDHADVVNMSLGSDFGSPQDGDSIATADASALGITMVVASGNNGDLYDTGGSPGDVPAALTVAASEDASAVVDGLNVTAPSSIAGSYPAERSIAYDYDDDPDLSGTVAQVKDPSNLDGCSALSAADAAAVAGKIAFVEWTDDDTVRRCGSVARSTNLANAGAIGFIFADDEEQFAAGITGSATIPGVLVAKSGGDAIRAQLAAGTTVTIGSTTKNGVDTLDEALNDTLASFSSRGIRGAGNVKPDVTAVGGSVFSAGMGTGNDGLNDSGTSMATPMVAGTAAIVKSLHPSWTPEQVKADIMNTANQDLYVKPNHSGKTYAPNRVGSGRIDIAEAAKNQVLAYVQDADDAPGVVSASFGPVEVSADTSMSKTIKVENTGTTDQTYNVTYRSSTSIPGAVWSVSPTSVAVAAGASTTVTVTLTLTKNLLTKTIDPTVDRLQGGNARQYVADTSGLVILKGSGTPNLRVPVYAAPRPVSTMTQAASISLPSGAVQKGLLPLTGGSINQGSAKTAIKSLVAGFELQGTSGVAPTCSATVTDECIAYPDESSADLKYVGAASSAPVLDSVNEDPTTSANGLTYFSITTQKPWRSPAGFQEFDIYVDADGDGVADYVVYNSRITGTDVMVANTIDLNSGATVDVEAINDSLGDTDTALFDSDTLVMPVAIGALGVTDGASRINYAVQSFGPSGLLDNVGDVANDGTITDGMSFDVLHPGVSVAGSYNGDSSPLLFVDSPGSVLSIQRDQAAYTADKGMGALLVHFQNADGSKAQVLGFDTEASQTALTLTPNPATIGSTVTAKATVTGAGVTPTGTVTFKQGTTTIGTANVGADGTATTTFTATAAGTASFTASYSGDVVYSASDSAPVTLTVSKTTSTTTLAVSPNPAPVGATVTATVTVTGSSPTGTVSVKSGTSVLGTGTLSNGTATVTFTPTAAGTSSLTATYAGDANNTASTSSAVSLVVSKKVGAPIHWAFSPTTVKHGTATAAKISVLPAGGFGTPTGKVQLVNTTGGKRVGLTTVTLVNGAASIPFTPTAAGTYTFTVVYSGDASYLSGQSGTVTLKVT